MFTNPEQFASATKTLFELQMMTFNALTSKAVQGVEQVVSLNMTTAKNSVQGTMAMGKEMSQAKDPKAAMDVAAAHAKPMAGAVVYGEQLKVIIDDIHSEFTQAADAHIAEAKSTLTALIYDVTQNVKPGSENAVEIIKTAIDNAFQGYEQVTKATRQAVQVVEDQIAKATAQVAPAEKNAA
ncbi:MULTISPECIES: TIGR01841 family phasin [Massilia]|uniref:Phasin family protein n=1 Tax=Massilia violaceinigra TaxID=2045208 RepID=A0A2D2DS00_9BURK|nr:MULTISPECIES: TIGR01841 family phasin [Massilia]ATQ77762.1 phasin family protein [Massilia violaceinigra]MDQ1832140.1 TIGR01841 family phasin [Massilia sp. CCM 9029]